MSFFNRQAAEQFDAPTTAVEDISGDYTIDPTHTRLGFSTRHAMVTTVRGHFTEFSGTAHVDAANPANSTVSLTIQTASIDTGVADRDGHLKLGRLLRRRQQQGDHLLLDQGRARRRRLGHHRRPHHQGRDQADHDHLRVHRLGARPVRQPARSASRVGTSINRKDWGLTWNAALETGGVLVSEKIKLEFDISAIQNTPEA